MVNKDFWTKLRSDASYSDLTSELKTRNRTNWCLLLQYLMLGTSLLQTPTMASSGTISVGASQEVFPLWFCCAHIYIYTYVKIVSKLFYWNKWVNWCAQVSAHGQKMRNSTRSCEGRQCNGIFETGTLAHHTLSNLRIPRGSTDALSLNTCRRLESIGFRSFFAIRHSDFL